MSALGADSGLVLTLSQETRHIFLPPRDQSYIMKIERSGDLIFWTYFMMDWSKTKQSPSGQKCLKCGAPMKSLEAVTDNKGRSYQGTVCHNCKQLLWVKSS